MARDLDTLEREHRRWTRAVLRNADPAPAMRRLIDVDRRLGARGVLGRARPLDRQAVRHLALKARLYADAMRRGYFMASVIMRNCGWGKKYDHRRDSSARRWWARWMQRLDREWVEDPELGAEAAAWIGLALEQWDVKPSQVTRAQHGDDDRDEAALDYYELAEPAEHAFALSQIGHLLRDRKRSRAERRRAADCLDRAARLGQVDAMCELGYCLMYGEGVAKDHRRGAQLYRRAAEACDYSAMFNLGMSYAQGHGVRRSIPKAVEWWLQAARRGSDRALEHLAWAFAEGPPSLRDPARARYYARRDAEDKARSAALDAQRAAAKSRR